MSTDKNYIGKATERNTQYGKLHSIYLGAEKLQQMLDKLPKDKNGIRLTMTEMRTADKYGNTHTIYEDTYEGQPRQEQSPQQPAAAEPEQPIDDDLPF